RRIGYRGDLLDQFHVLDLLALEGIRRARQFEENVGLGLGARCGHNALTVSRLQFVRRAFAVWVSDTESRMSTARPSPNSVAPEIPGTFNSGSFTGLTTTSR